MGTSFGFGACTNFPRDLVNSDCILLMGCNMAESHPVGFRWPLLAQKQGTPLIHVDPRYTRTSAIADVHVAIRPGTDLAFLGGLVRYIIENKRYFEEYVVHYTNAATLLTSEYHHDSETGLFAGYNPATHRYDLAPHAWEYDMEIGADGSPTQPKTDPTLQDPRCVFQALKRHYDGYTPEAVANVCGCRPEDVVKVAELLCQNSGRERTSAMAYALGWTQHGTGVQMIRAAAIVQLLLGNIGRPGGGIIALRGHANVQGATDIPTLFNNLPNYLPMPHATPTQATLADYLANGHSAGARRGGATDGLWKMDVTHGSWASLPQYIISLLKAWYGDAATAENEFGYQWLPKLDDDESEMSYMIRMHRGDIKGFMLFGQNPAVSSPNARLQRDAMRKLKWLVALDLFETESAAVWYADPEGPDPKSVATEVFLLPAAASTEKDGSVTNTERLVQWHTRVVDSPGDCHSDLWWVYQLGKRLKALYAASTLERDAPIRNLTWDYERPATSPGAASADEPDAECVLREINGYSTATGEHLKSGAELAADGSTACGSRLYAGVFPEPGRNLARRLDGTVRDGIFADWGWAWPNNSRVLYNRASADPQGQPWSERKRLVWWDAAQGRWVGHDVPQFAVTKAPDYQPPADARGGAALPGDAPFGAHFDGRGWLYVPFGLADGPLPVHYEPLESPYRNALVSTQYAPATTVFEDPLNPVAVPLDPAYPLVATTYRVTEQYLSGAMTRHNSWLVELQPAMFVEISPALAAERGVKNLDWVVVSTPRDSIEARALVTERVPTLTVDGRPSHVVGLLWSFGYKGEAVGDSANLLSAMALAPTSDIQGTKSFACQLRAGRLTDERPMQPTPLVPLPQVTLPVVDTAWAAQPEGSIQHDD
ncbi:MAG: molybdopterin-dependent oxidoreductase [Anaerolineae bacterium]